MLFRSRLIGKRLAQSLAGSAKLLVNHLTAEQLVNEQSYELVLQAVLDPNRQYSDPKIEDSFEKAIFKTFREKGETPTHFLNKKKAAFFSLKQDGLDFMSSKEGRHLVGWLVIRQGRFNDDQKRALKTRTGGKIEIDILDPAIRQIIPDDTAMATSATASRTFPTFDGDGIPKADAPEYDPEAPAP